MAKFTFGDQVIDCLKRRLGHEPAPEEVSRELSIIGLGKTSEAILKPAAIIKTCKCCGQIFTTVPSNARPWKDDGELLGVFWECSCKSTMFLREEVA